MTLALCEGAAGACDALALINHAPTTADEGGVGANVKLEAALQPVRNQTGEIEL